MRHYLGNQEKGGRSRYWLTVAAVAAAVAGSAITAASATAGGAPATARPGADSTLYAVGKPACLAVKSSDRATCDAMIREIVSAGTKGAKPFRVGLAGTIGPAGGLTPSDLATAYGLKTTGGTGQTVAIVDAYNDPNIASD